MSSSLPKAIANLSAGDPSVRVLAATEIYGQGRALADPVLSRWLANPDFSALAGKPPVIIVGVAVSRDVFAAIRRANGEPRLAKVPPDIDAEEFELHFPKDIFLDVLTSRDPGGEGAIARYLRKLGEGIQQVELRCANVSRAAGILKKDFDVMPIYPQARTGAENTLVNFFLVPTPDTGKVLIELFETLAG